MSAGELARYAEAIVRGSLAFTRGDVLLVECSHAHRELAVALAEAAYRAGGAAVDIAYDDARAFASLIRDGTEAALGTLTPWHLARLRALGTERVARVLVRGEFESEVLGALPAERVAETARRRQAATPGFARARREGRLRQTICAWPTAEWASRVFGSDTPRAERRLARDLLEFCRIGAGDPPGHRGWTDHLAMLRRRASRLTKLGLREVELRDRDAALRVRLPETAVWRGGGERTHWGRFVAMNIPTEECFVSPEAAATDGTFRCSRPLSFGGRLIDGLAGEFRAGRLVRLDAARRADRDWLARYLASVPNADRLGEIALVDSTSRIGRTGRVYYNTLLDENAVAHIAFGSGFPKTRSVPLGRSRHGVNAAAVHIDVMIGTDDFEAVGITESGRRVDLLRDGLWQL